MSTLQNVDLTKCRPKNVDLAMLPQAFLPTLTQKDKGKEEN